jgi:hypothetical protein
MGSGQITLTRESGSTQTFVPAKQYYFIRQDDQIEGGYDRPALNRPMVFRLETHRSVPFTRFMQEYCFRLNRSDDEARDRRVFADCWDTWVTNARKVRDHANYITGERLEKDDPSWANLVMGRNVICGDEVESNGTFGITAGVQCLRVRTLHPSVLPGGMTYESDPEYIHHCTIINSAMYAGLHKVLPFPQMGGKSTPPKRPVFYPLISDRAVYIPMAHLIKLPLGGQIPNPYNPGWVW